MARSRQAPDYETAQRKMETNLFIRTALRVLIMINMVTYLGLGYSLLYVKPGDPAYYVSLLTLVLNTALFAAAVVTVVKLKKKHAQHEAALKQFEDQGGSAPWIV